MVVVISVGLRKLWVMVALEFDCNNAQSKTLLHLPLKQVMKYWNKSRHTCRIRLPGTIFIPKLLKCNKHHLSLFLKVLHSFNQFFNS